MASVAIRAVPHVAADARVMRSRLGLRVADSAGEDRKRRLAGVAVGACIRAMVRNAEPRMVERRSGPPRGRVTVLAGRGEPGGRVVRTRRGIVRRLVAGGAERALAGVYPVTVALRASDRQVRSGQREACPGMAEARSRPQRRRVALDAVGRDAACRVIRIGGRLVLGAMAVHTFRSPAHKRQPSLGRRCVAPFAVHRDVRSGQRKAGLLMRAHHARTVEKVSRRVAARAVGAELAAMHVPVARRAFGRSVFEIERRVTRPARRLPVRPCQWESRFRVVERGADPYRHPTLGRVTHRAGLLQRTVRVLGRLLRSH